MNFLFGWRAECASGYFNVIVGLTAAIFLTGCDELARRELVAGQSTEADVTARFGQPERVWSQPDGARAFEYNRQPAGTENFMIIIGGDGKMREFRQVLNRKNFAEIVPGMAAETVREKLGKPAKIMPLKLQHEINWEWRFCDQPCVRRFLFRTVFSEDYRVKHTQIVPDPHDLLQGTQRN